MNKNIQISNIAILNRETYRKSVLPSFLNYLDTGNLTKNKVDTLQYLNTIKDKIPSRAQRKIQKRTILYSTVRPNQEHYGFFEEMIENLIVSTGFTTIDVIDNNVDSKFIYFLLTQRHITDYLHTIGMNSVSSYPSISPTDIGNLKFKIPSSIQIQKSIAKVLSDLDAKIELNNKINQELEAMAKMLYDYWFVQFDFPNPTTSSGQVGKPYKTSGGKMVFNEELKRDIPEGWEVDSLVSWLGNFKNGDWGKETEQGNYVTKVSCVRGADINGLNGKGKLKSPERYILEKNEHKILESHDLIVEISGGSPVQSTGRLGYIIEDTKKRFNNPLICSNFCKVVSLKDEKKLYNFVYLWQRLYDAGVLFGWEGKTSGIKNLLFDSFVNSYQTVVPNKEIAEKFYDFMEPIQAKKQKNLLENQQLAELRDWLLPMLMNGQVTVKK